MCIYTLLNNNMTNDGTPFFFGRLPLGWWSAAHRLNDVIRQTPGPEGVRGVGGVHEVLGAGDVAVHPRLVLPIGLHHPRVTRVYGHAPDHQAEAPELTDTRVNIVQWKLDLVFDYIKLKE